MADQSNRKPPDDIELRVRPRPVRRINRKILMGGTALFSGLLFGAVWFALNPPDFRGRPQVQELYNTDRKPTAEGLAGLPSTYDAISKLGPPLPGDFGDALHKVETGKGAELPLGDRPFQPDPEAEIGRADRIRLARLAQQGRESKLFYTIAGAAKSGDATKAETNVTQTTSSPFAAHPRSSLSIRRPAPTRSTSRVHPSSMPKCFPSPVPTASAFKRCG